MEDDAYYEITAQLDAREILRYLNNLGIQNISGELLKCFITDLKKLIKYDLQHKNGKDTVRSCEIGPERLHSASTFSSRSRSKGQQNFTSCTKECQKAKRIFSTRNIQSAPNIGTQKLDINSFKRACSCVKIEQKPEVTSKETKTTFNQNNNLIKIPKQPMKKKCDPVSLYHYYTSLWAKYKGNVPGENDWSELRWSIRQKMAGNIITAQSLKTNSAPKKVEITKKS